MKTVINLEIIRPPEMIKAYWMEVLDTEEKAIWLDPEYMEAA